MKQSVERRQAITKNLEDLSIPYTLVEGVVGHTLDAKSIQKIYDARRRLKYYGKALTSGELGCMYSHYSIYQQMVEQRIERAIILEDDALVRRDFIDIVNKIVTFPFSWDLIRFSTNKKVYRLVRNLGLVYHHYSLVRMLSTGGNATCNLISMNGAKILIKQLQAGNIFPIDVLHAQVWKTALKVYEVMPSPVSLNPFPPLIGEKRFNKELEIAGAQKLMYPIYKFLRKYVMTLGKRWVFILAWWRDLAVKKAIQGRCSTE